MTNSTNTSNDLSSKFALDVKDMGSLRQSAKAGSPEALKTAATQFEAMFVNMMMKSMRDATPQDGMMDSQQTKMFTTMLDQQTSQNIAKKGIGLSDMLIRQLSKTADKQALAIGGEAGDSASGVNGGSFAGAASLMDAKLQRAIAAAGGPGAVGSVDDNSAVPATIKSTQPSHVRNFQEKLGAHAEEASRTTGIPAKFMLGQAALESGWGKREIKGRDGTNSHNLFGIKAGGDWKGKVVEATTTEYVNGKAQTRVERFRAYDSYSDSFKDYGKLLASNPRYEKVLASAGDASSFAQGLQKAGYATDPHYASKLTSIIKRSLAG
ncbi:flagellar assembly peptidoglycan hydrolase FlgJ [Duganella sp. LjRoot269]|jgi:flagellar protein FlgJ|uniref:flagellar assembly peptidoglycan hydrolase FlgJ n=1 Tax=Duganella sp. LjRoot269 TaxID=3342305 RepID=UPI003ED0D942